MQDKTTLGISDTFRAYIEELVKAVVLEGVSFDNQKKWLRKYCEAEGVEYATLETNLSDFFQSMEEYKSLHSKSGERLARLLARECYISDIIVDRVMSENGKPNTTTVSHPNKRENEPDLFKVDNGVLYAKRKIAGRVTIPSQLNGQTITDIGERAFADCTDLKSIIIPETVLGIGNNAFRNCCGLTSVSFPDASSLIEIGDWAFGNCTGLTSIVIPSIQLKRIGNNAFNSCFNLASIDMMATEIGKMAFYKCGLKTIYLSSTINIEDNAFAECQRLESIILPYSITQIERGAFTGCCNLKEVCIPDSVTTIGDYAFCESGLVSVYIPNSVTKIGKGVFFQCVGLEDVYIPGSVIEIGSSVFLSCSNLKIIYIHDPSLLKDAQVPQGVRIERL